MTETDNLTLLKDDMIAFIEGHGIRHFPALIPEDVPRVWWNDPTNMESWKDFVEMAKTVNVPLIMIGEDPLEKATLEMLLEELQELTSLNEMVADIEEAQRLQMHVGKIGHIELAFAHEGFLFVHETVTGWYSQYRHLVETIDYMQDVLDPSTSSDDEEMG
ncbi:MAG TPA: hypothetical protein VHX63_17565 [Acidobacteriaceae bacterium]|jgi:hypothetical protein|nr:hypothetical protein [Acidobacteriaceae bacterium]